MEELKKLIEQNEMIIKQNDLIIQQNADILENLHDIDNDFLRDRADNKVNTQFADLVTFLMFVMLAVLDVAVVYFIFKYFNDWNYAISGLKSFLQGISNIIR